MTDLVPMRQIARMPPCFDDGMWQVAQSEAVIPDAEQGDTRFRVSDPVAFRRAYPVGVTPLTYAHEPDASRYTLHRGSDLLSVLDYRDDGRSVAMTRAYTVPAFRGHGYAAQLVDHAVAVLERSGDRVVVPVCWYVADWFAAHPERAGIVATRRSA